MPVDKNSTKRTRVSLLKDLIRRRVPQILGIYLATSWAIIEFLDWLINRYQISPHILDFGLVILASMIPTVIMLSYFHGRPGRDKWTLTEIIGIPSNILGAVIVIILLFRGTDLGAMTAKINLINENGDEIEKVVVKNEYKKKIFIFNIENRTGETVLDYLTYGIPIMANYDLSQDLFITPELSTVSYDKMVSAGFEKTTGLPVTLMKELAEKRHMNYFMFGYLDKHTDTLILDLKIYETKLAKLLTEITVKDRSPFGLIDKLSVRIKNELGLSEYHIANTVDLPVSEILTGSERALYYFTLFAESEVVNKWEENLGQLELAIREDPDFALAYFTYGMSLFNLSKVDEAKNALVTAMDLLFKLPESQQFALKYVYYVMFEQPDKVMTILKMWTELLPDDLLAHTIAAQRFYIKGMVDEAIKEYKEILRIDPEQYNILIDLGDLYLELENPDSSLRYYQLYADNFPQQSVSYNNLGNYYRTLCDWDLAKENYKRAFLMADGTEKVSMQIKLADLGMKTGKFDQAFEQYNEALRMSQSTADSVKVFDAFEGYYLIKGKVNRSLEFYERKIGIYKEIVAPRDILVLRVFTIEPYIYAGKPDRAVEILHEIEPMLEPPLDKVLSFGYLVYYSETGDAEKALNEIPKAMELIESFGEEILLANIYHAEGRINELKQKYQEAIESYNNYWDLAPSSTIVYEDIARCYRYLKDYKKAIKNINEGLRHNPYSPTMNYEAALVYFDIGEMQISMEYLEKAVEIWKDADSHYEKARIAGEKLAEWSK